MKLYCYAFKPVLKTIKNHPITNCTDLKNGTFCINIITSSKYLVKRSDFHFTILFRAVLTLASKYFKALFTTKLSGRIRLDYCIPGISKYVLQRIIDYAYNGWVDLTDETVTQILIGADYLNVLGLLKKCCDFILVGMDSENCQSIKKFANYYFCFDLESAAER